MGGIMPLSKRVQSQKKSHPTARADNATSLGNDSDAHYGAKYNTPFESLTDFPIDRIEGHLASKRMVWCFICDGTADGIKSKGKKCNAPCQ